MIPFTLSLREDETTSVEPGSTGTSSASHSFKPDRSEPNDVSWRELNSQRNSRSWICLWSVFGYTRRYVYVGLLLWRPLGHAALVLVAVVGLVLS